MRLIDADALNVRLSTLDRLARSDAQAALLGRVFYAVSNQPTVDAIPVERLCSQEFDLKSIPDEVMKGVRDNIKMWDAALQKRNDEIIKMKQEEIERLKAQYDELVGDEKECIIPNPNYIKYPYCPCMNCGDGGFVIDE